VTLQTCKELTIADHWNFGTSKVLKV